MICRFVTIDGIDIGLRDDGRLIDRERKREYVQGEWVPMSEQELLETHPLYQLGRQIAQEREERLLSLLR